MILTDDAEVSEHDLDEIRRVAQNALISADAVGVFPTPVDQILEAAKIEVVPITLDENYLSRLRASAGRALLSAITKVWGVLDHKSRIAFIDPNTPREKLPFLKLHEGGHALLKWQEIYGYFEDCRLTLNPDTKMLFERQANVFASEVLFQLNSYSAVASDFTFGIEVPLKLAKQYGASVYSSIRRYVSQNERESVLLVLNPAEVTDAGSFYSLRRVVTSRSYREKFKGVCWPELITNSHPLYKLIPRRRMTYPREIALSDDNGCIQTWMGEAFKTTHHVFLLLYASHRGIQLRRSSRTLIIPEASNWHRSSDT